MKKVEPDPSFILLKLKLSLIYSILKDLRIDYHPREALVFSSLL